MPNLLISLHPDYVMTHRLEPLAPDRTTIECQWLFDPECGGTDGFDPSYAVDFWDLTNRQDWAACEGVQRGVGLAGLPARAVRRRRGRRASSPVRRRLHGAGRYLADPASYARRIVPGVSRPTDQQHRDRQ